MSAPNGVAVTVRHLGDFTLAEGTHGLRATAFSIRIVDDTAQELTLPQSAVAIFTTDHRTLFPSAGISFKGAACFAYSHGNLTLMPRTDFTYPAPLCFVLESPNRPAAVPTDLLVDVGSTVDFRLR
ncbi:MAG: hypothetical protein E6J45_07885 [Chloroflexi bacterium]|nr:MAG: hypothetical protein E6J45_07885 [Chloroflexota bacterium]